MIQYSSFNRRMESINHFKNETSSKSRKRSGNFLRKACMALLMAGVIFAGSSGKMEAQTAIKNDSIKPYINFLNRNKFLSAKDYILSKFETQDIVVLTERIHQDITQYEVIMDVIKDPRFKGNVYTEIGCTNLTEKFNKFLLNDTITEAEKEKELLAIYRDLTPGGLIWASYSYYQLLNEVWELNKNRKPEDKVLIFPLDVPCDYENEIKTHGEYAVLFNYLFDGGYRDLIMGNNFVNSYEKVKNEKKKALVILNSTHGVKQTPAYLPLPTEPNIRSAGEFIHRTYPEKTVNIYINSFDMDKNIFILSNNGIIDAAFDYTKKDNVGFDLKNTPVGDTKFDAFGFGTRADPTGKYDTNIRFDYLFDGMIFYKQAKDMMLKVGIPGLYSEEYEDMYFTRVALIFGNTVEEAKNDNQFVEALKQINKPVEVSMDKMFETKVWDSQIKHWIE